MAGALAGEGPGPATTMYKIVERPPGAPSATFECDGQAYPLPCLVEDSQGSRLLLVHDIGMPLPVWEWALASGAMAIVATAHSVATTKAIFVEYREQGGNNLFLDPEHWIPHTWDDTVTGIYRAQRDAALAEVTTNGFVHLHTHSEYSALDGLSRMDEIVAAVKRDNNPALAITDHGTCAGHPDLQDACDKAGITPIFGLEAYFVDDRAEKERDYYHLCLWAMDDEGLRNLWALSTASQVSIEQGGGFYYKPRVDWELLERHSEGLIASTACLRGPLLHPWLKADLSLAETNLERLLRIFGDRLYIELHANQLPQQIEANKWLVETAQRYSVPMIAVVDSHYAEAAHKHDHRLWLSIQTNSDVADETDLFGGNQDYHLLTRDEVIASLLYLDTEVIIESIANTVRLAERCTARIVGKEHNPIFTRASDAHPTPEAREEEDIRRLVARCEARLAVCAEGKTLPLDAYELRLKEELELILPKKFCGYFLIVAAIVQHAKDNRVLIGPGRGSVGGSLTAYLLGITEVDPVEYDLMFGRFLTAGRVEPPDIDLDFPSSKKQFMLDFVAERWGREHSATVGTHLRVQSKGVVRDVARAMKSQLPEDYWRDIDAVSAIIGEAEAGTAGLGMPWEALWEEHEEVLKPYRKKYPELFAFCDQLHGRLKTYGAHPAGVVIDPDNSIFDALPLRRADSGQMVTQFDMVAITLLGQLKVDLLNLRTLDTLQATLDSIYARTGRWINLYGFREELHDAQVYEEISNGWTLGLFQIETQVGTAMCKRLRPDSILALADVITLVRPGPMRSGLTELYLQRRSGEEETFYADPRLEPYLKDTFGCMIYQENILAVCMVLAGYDSTEADGVRKILGKKLVEKVLEAGKKFIAAAVANGMARADAEALWAQMAEFAKYGFGKAHAVAYALLGYWTAWLKVHYPVDTLTALLSTVKQERIPEFVDEARRMGYAVLPPDINASGRGFVADGNTVRYGLDSVKGVGEAALNAILEARAEAEFIDYDDFLERKGPKCNAGHVKTLVRIGAFDSVEPNRRGLEERIRLEEVAAMGASSCAWREPAERSVIWLPKPIPSDQRQRLQAAEEGDRQAILGEWTERADWRLPCAFPWISEEDQANPKTGKLMARKPPPKRCTRSCRQFVAPEIPDCSDIAPYTDAEIRAIELEVLGLYLSSTPFDEIPSEVMEGLVTGYELQVAGPGTYLLAAVITGVRRHTTKASQKKMAFVSADTPQGKIDFAVFPKFWLAYSSQLRERHLVVVALRKEEDGRCHMVQVESLMEA